MINSGCVRINVFILLIFSIKLSAFGNMSSSISFYLSLHVLSQFAYLRHVAYATLSPKLHVLDLAILNRQGLHLVKITNVSVPPFVL